MHFPVAGIDVSPLVPVLVAFCISVVTSTGGVSGAFLLLPFQMSVLGFTSPAVSATNHLYNVVAIPGGMARYVREGRMLWPLAGIVVAGTVPGVLVGTVLRLRWLPDPGRFRVFAGMVLLAVAAQMVYGIVRGRERRPAGATSAPGTDTSGHGGGGPWRLTLLGRGPDGIAYRFRGEVHAFRPRSVLLLALVVGVVGGAYGIGGGAIIAPVVVGLFGLPVHTVAGAALLGTFVTSLVGVTFYRVLAPFHPGVAVGPDWALGLLFGVGGLAGTWCGAWLQRRIPDAWIRGMLVLVLAFLGLRYVLVS